MYLNKVTIRNIRSISSFEMTFGTPQGWHVLIGDNGAGKSTIVRSIALGIIGPADAKALRLNLNDWAKKDTSKGGEIALSITKHEVDGKVGRSRNRVKPFDATVTLVKNDRTGYTLAGTKGAPEENIWSNRAGWFSCAFGPFRRFTGGEKEWMKVYYSDPRAAAHLSVFGEDVALTEAIDWLKSLHIKSLESGQNTSSSANESYTTVLDSLKAFINEGGLLPHNAKLDSISSEGVFFVDGNGNRVDVTQMSDGYRSILSLTFELLRQLERAYGHKAVYQNFNKGIYTVELPGVVLIDEVDAHLHPTWQTRIGDWFTSVFPQIQFIVTTHSPLICRASDKGSIWRLRAPGSEQKSGEVTGTDKDRLLYGDLLDAYGTGLFGRNVTQSQTGQAINQELAMLNMKSFKEKLSAPEKNKLQELKTISTHISGSFNQQTSIAPSVLDLDVIIPLFNQLEESAEKKKPVNLSKKELELLKSLKGKDVATKK